MKEADGKQTEKMRVRGEHQGIVMLKQHSHNVGIVSRVLLKFIFSEFVQGENMSPSLFGLLASLKLTLQILITNIMKLVITRLAVTVRQEEKAGC